MGGALSTLALWRQRRFFWDKGPFGCWVVWWSLTGIVWHNDPEVKKHIYRSSDSIVFLQVLDKRLKSKKGLNV